jgi:2-methylcitrate dehydratase PrpD
VDAIDRFVRHVVETPREAIPAPAREATRRLLLDTLGVGVAGSAGPWVRELIASQALSLAGDQAGVWVHGDRLSAAGAAMCNGYLIHNAEFDCVHEQAVVHAMTLPTAVALAWAEREGGVSGATLVDALALGVDVACLLGVACREGLRFFRPATAGAFGGVAAIARIAGFDADTLLNAFGTVHAQLSGTMQAHAEGSPVLGMQIGFNARNAVIACDMAARGIVAPHAVLEGRFGYYALFEGAHDLAAVLPQLGTPWRVTEIAHKPFPSGRATHGVVDGCRTLMRAQGFVAQDVERVRARVPPLVHHLVGRPVTAAMSPNSARLCASYVAACALLRGDVTLEDFRAPALGHADTLALARRIAIEVDANPDPNALTPVSVEITLKDGRRVETRLDAVIGNPRRPMGREAELEKLQRNFASAARPMPRAKAERLTAVVDGLERIGDVRELIECLI